MNLNQQLAQVMQFIQQNGGDAKSLFYAMAQQKGVNPDDILNQTRLMLKNQNGRSV